MKLTITETQYKQLPERLQKIFTKMYNPSCEEVRECFPETNKQAKCKTDNKSGWQTQFVGGKIKSPIERKLYLDSDNGGNASRFFKSIVYQAKASKSERKLEDGSYSTHPTVKPIALMEYLIKMVTPKGGIVLDPFAGSGTTLVAAKQNGFQYVGFELTDEYMPIIEARINAVNNS